jgi:hypothetical protein
LSSADFAPLLLAQGVMLAGLMADRIFFAGAKLTDFKMEILGGVAVLLLLVLGPLLVFSPCLMRFPLSFEFKTPLTHNALFCIFNPPRSEFLSNIKSPKPQSLGNVCSPC